MKAIYLLCAFGLFAAVFATQAADAQPAAKTAAAAPGFADPSKLTEKAPDTFKAQFDTTKGKITIEVTRALSPNGADRFYNLVRSGYFKDIAFFRVVAALGGNPENEIVVVDNGSADGSAEFVRKAFPDVKVLALGRNLGFGGGSNA